MIKLILLLLFFSGCLTFLPDETQIDPLLTISVTDFQLKNHEEDITQIFGKRHLSLSANPKEIKQAKTVIYGQDDRVIVMLEVRLAKKKCKFSRNVVFMIDTGAPFTVISPSVRKILFSDCQINEGTREKTTVKINEREIMVRIAQNYYHDTNVLGMDYMKANNIDFSMRINKFYRDKSQLHFKFDTFRDEEEL